MDTTAQTIPPLSEAPAGCTWDLTPVTGHGSAGDREAVEPGRYVLLVPGRPWAARPERCTHTGPGEWIGDQVLVCPGCGVDGT